MAQLDSINEAAKLSDRVGAGLCMRLSAIGCVISLLLAACGETSSPDEPPRVPIAFTGTKTAAPPAKIPMTKPVPVPNYDEREGDTYLYATAVSEEDEKKGKSVGDVVMFRYLGDSDGKHMIASVDDAGRIFGRHQCSKPCKIIKTNYSGRIGRIPFSPRSVIGAAFEDALNGRLQVASKPGGRAEQVAPPAATVPAAFIGEWNEDLQACGTGNNDSRLRIEPRRVRFYESDGTVQRVAVANERAIKVSASFAGEGQVWTNEVEFVLSRSGNELSSTDITRYRCPA